MRFVNEEQRKTELQETDQLLDVSSKLIKDALIIEY